ncbi:hypothetical protein LZL36_11020 [Pseudomonas aeruginosa]|nr:hypothetical protein [Pseudomonas aeruginosa]
MSRTNTQTHELRHPDTGHTVFADFGSRSFSHFLNLGYSYPEVESGPTEAPEAKPAKKPRTKPAAKEADNGNDSP